jgi:hypothetical protein
MAAVSLTPDGQLSPESPAFTTPGSVPSSASKTPNDQSTKENDEEEDIEMWTGAPWTPDEVSCKRVHIRICVLAFEWISSSSKVSSFSLSASSLLI